LYKSRVRSSSKGRQSQKCKNRVGSVKNLPLTNHKARNIRFTQKPLDIMKKSWSPGVGWGHDGENHFYMKTSFLQNQQANFNQTSSGKRYLKLYKSRAKSSSKGR
jgi:hypothetical protein